MYKRMMMLITFVSVLVSAHSQDLLRSSKGNWEVEVARNGAICSLKMDFGKDSLVSVPWHNTGEYAGPAFPGVSMSKAGFFLYRSREVYPVNHSVSYSDENGNLAITVTVTNNSGTVRKMTHEATWRLGINTIMSNPKTYFSVFFPTMLRCERTYFWGYFESPNGEVMAITSPDAVASWHLDYIGNGHRIGSASIDLMHQLPLPSRHPQDMTQLMPHETKSWKFYLLPVKSIKEVQAAVAKVTEAPAIQLERTTASAGEVVDITVISHAKVAPRVQLISSENKDTTLLPKKHKGCIYTYEMAAPQKAGTYSLIATTNGQKSEASLYVRRPWSWYLRQAGREALRMQQKPSAHRESWMGFFSAYWSLVYFPDSAMQNETEAKFDEFLGLMIDPQTKFWYKNKKTWHVRPQNTSWMVGVLVARYAATHKKEHLEMAAQWADFLIDKFQMPNGAYKGYTALTMGAKFLHELMKQEAPLAASDPTWKARYEKHQCSVQAAAANLLAVKDMGDTEGEATYEDNQAGSAWSLLAMHSLLAADRGEADRFLQAALEVQKRHECLTQALVPDSRMRGGTLRWWEAQYDVLIRRNMMNSPHGWTMRSQFGAMYLYLLTGKEYYLHVAFNTMASCSQAVDLSSGELRWAFVPDPYVEIERFEQDYRSSGEGHYVGDVIGEQWIPMVSNWWRTREGEVVFNREHGWSCDNDVHEHFRFMAEMYVPNAFVVERADGSLRSWNCTVRKQGDKLLVAPAENTVSKVHFNLQKRHDIEVGFADGIAHATLEKGMEWVNNR